MRPWCPYGEEVVARLRSIEVDDGINADERPLVVAAGVRFVPSTIDSSARLTFYEPMERHFGLSPGKKSELYVLSSVDRIEIWNDQYYAEARARMGDKLKQFFPWVGTQY